MSKLDIIKALSWSTTQFYMERGGIEMKCHEATVHVIRLAKKADIKLEARAGFFGGQQHNWAWSPDLSVIVDPTGAQFTKGRNGVITSEDREYKSYLCIPEEWVYSLPRATSQQYWAALSMKRWMDAGCEPTIKRGENIEQPRIDKNGRPYVYKSFAVYMGVKPNDLRLRSMLVFPNRNGTGYTANAILIKRVLKADGKEIFPTSFMRMVLRNGLYFWSFTSNFGDDFPRKSKLTYTIPENPVLNSMFYTVCKDMSDVVYSNREHLGGVGVERIGYYPMADEDEPF